MIFRNDDLAYGSNVDKYLEIQKIFEEFGIREMYSVVTFGGNLYEGDPYAMSLELLEKRLGVLPIIFDKKVDDFIKYSLKRGHTISLHGWQHTRIDKYSFKEQLEKIRTAKNLLEKQYEVKIDYFVPPFNNYNADTEKVCDQLNLKILGTSENRLERSVREHLEPSDNNYTWYHAWRFYTDGLSPEKLREYLIWLTRSQKTGRLF